MPDIVVTAHGQEWLLNAGFRDEYPGSRTVTYEWFSVDETPTPASVLNDFDPIISGTIAPHVEVEETDWLSPTSADGLTTLETEPVSISIEGACTVRGYTVKDGDDNLLWARRFDTDLVYGDSGGTLTFTPTFQLRSPIIEAEEE